MKTVFLIMLLFHISHPSFAAHPKNARHSPPTAVLQIDINHADLTTLQQLKGVGKKKAQDIIDYREKHHGFKNIEEIKMIKGFGKSLFAKLKKKIIVPSF